MHRPPRPHDCQPPRPALIGLSAGGVGAFNIGLRHLAVFASVESWSGCFAATDPTGLRELDLASPRANRRAPVPRAQHLISALSRWPSFIGFFVGRQDTRFREANLLLDRAWTEDGMPHLFRIYPGGRSGALWTAEAPLWLSYAVQHPEASY